MTCQVASHDGHATAEVITAVITGLDSQIDNGTATIANTLVPLTGGLSLTVEEALLGPFAQLVTNGAQAVISNLFSTTLNKAVNFGSQYNIDTSRLSAAAKKLSTAAPHYHKNEDPITERVKGSATNYRQTIDALTRQLVSHNSHTTTDVITTVITGLNSQTNNIIATMSQVFAPLTGDLSMAVANAFLGPFFQSVTNGAEVVVSNLVGAPIDLVEDDTTMALTTTL